MVIVGQETTCMGWFVGWFIRAKLASLESFGDASFALINHPTNQPMHVVSWPTITTRLCLGVVLYY
jgi:hypothetical protein